MTMLKKTIAIHRPQLPTSLEILPYLRRIDEARWYSNFGQLLREFEARTAALFGLKPENITSAANGTLMLTAILRALDLPAGTLCVMPSWTFIATAAAAHHAGLVPYFVDVDIETQALDPERLRSEIGEMKADVGAVIVVAPFGAPIDRAAWSRFMDDTGIPVIIDAAAGFDAVSKVSEMKADHIPTMISLHATKVFGIGEGGLVLCEDEILVNKIKSLISFGFRGGREAITLGFNAKLSEYSAAVGLASLDGWDQTRFKWETTRNTYMKELRKKEIKHFFDDRWISGTCNVILAYQAKQVGLQLIQNGIDTRQWWLDGCHYHDGYKNFPRSSDLKNTDWLGASVLGLPYSIDMTQDEIITICSALHEIMITSNNKFEIAQ